MIPTNIYTRVQPAQEEAARERANPAERAETAAPERAASFQDVLQGKIFDHLELTFSKHASVRLDTRGIALSPAQMARMEDGVRRAKEKGIQDSLVLLDNMAFLVNTKSKTVITAMHRDTEHVYTNIDGAVIV